MRSIFKGPFVTSSIYRNLIKTFKKIYFIKKKNSVIVPEFVNKRVKVYNGKHFFNFLILPEMVGYKFGCFVFTRKSNAFVKK